jgi:site-specific recombinase
MAGAGTTGNRKSSKSSLSLSEQAHQQALDYLREAEKSLHPELRAAALGMAKQTLKHYRKQSARVSPNLILLLNVALGIIVGLGSWYAFLHFPARLAYELTAVSMLTFLVIVGVSLFLPGYLSQANFMKILGWAISHIKGLGKFRDTKEPAE